MSPSKRCKTDSTGRCRGSASSVMQCLLSESDNHSHKSRHTARLPEVTGLRHVCDHDCRCHQASASGQLAWVAIVDLRHQSCLVLGESSDHGRRAPEAAGPPGMKSLIAAPTIVTTIVMPLDPGSPGSRLAFPTLIKNTFYFLLCTDVHVRTITPITPAWPARR